MWGQICTESSYQLNFNFGFSTYKSDILLHLSQWQYWWWFWFSFFWSFYYFVIIRVVKNRVTKMNLKINTSLRGRGKWGDFLIAVLPLSWCANILLNSNFILRMFEWQNESSLFTVRIHGKQWYWVYKFDLIDAIDILTVPKNMGRNRWVVGTPQELIVCESYLQAIQLRSQEDWIKNYWKKKIENDYKTFKNIELGALVTNNEILQQIDIFKNKNDFKIEEECLNNIEDNNIFFQFKPTNFKMPINFNFNNLKNNYKLNFLNYTEFQHFKTNFFSFKKNYIEFFKSKLNYKKIFNIKQFSYNNNNFVEILNNNNEQLFINKYKKIMLSNSDDYVLNDLKNNFTKIKNKTTVIQLNFFENWLLYVFNKQIYSPQLSNIYNYSNIVKKLIDNTYFNEYPQSINFFSNYYDFKKYELDFFTNSDIQFKNFYKIFNNFLIFDELQIIKNKTMVLFNNLLDNYKNTIKLNLKFKNYYKNFDFNNDLNFKFKDLRQTLIGQDLSKLSFNKLNFPLLNINIDYKLFDFIYNIKKILKKNTLFNYNLVEDSFFLNLYENLENNENFYYNYDELDDTWDVENNIRQKTSVGPIRLVKHLLTPEYFKNNSDLLKFNFFENNNQTTTKIPDNNNFWVLKQKRYKKKQLIKSSFSKDLEYADFETIRNIYRKHIIENIKLIVDLDFKMDPYNLYKCIRGNRNRTESLPIYLYRRLLRTKKTLVLPAHINMTVVTNSYDVVHSWFLPGLGIKMDCVPGRSTHHSLYLDNIGFYYGQCAEICGRYHHHMPIRLCALPFEHFLVWWNLKGLPKLLKLKKNKIGLINHATLKYTW